MGVGQLLSPACTVETPSSVGDTVEMWRCGDPPSMWQISDNPGQEMLVGLSNIKLGNLLAGLHPRDVKRHGYTLRYLEAKAEKMYQAGKQMQTNLSAAQRTLTFNNNRRILEEARRHTTEEVQGL